MKLPTFLKGAAVAVLSFSNLGFAQYAANRYALILEDAPVMMQAESRTGLTSAKALQHKANVAARQRTLITELNKRNIAVTGTVSTIANAVFVSAAPDAIAEMSKLPGVLGAVRLRRYSMKLNRAAQLINAPAAWGILGGSANAGAGVKIAILDSGIDQSNAAFQDSSLVMPKGYPICSGDDCAFTNNKVIVARSYTRMLAAGTEPNPAIDSHPDDYSPRDRSGHGTAAASCAAGVPVVGTAPISGVAPKAWLGNYRIFGSPQVNDVTSDDVILKALDDAFNDGMDIVSFSVGGPAFSGPLDIGEVCGNAAGVPCDLVAKVFDDVSKKGMIIVSSAGNEGADGTANGPSYGTIGSPASAPAVIAVGASTNSHDFDYLLTVPGADVPPELKSIAVQPGDSSIMGAITAPLRDVTVTGNDGLGCTAFPAASLVGTIALVLRGTCSFSTKALNAEDAGAVGVVIYMADASALVSPALGSASIPGVVISNSDGVALRNYLSTSPEHAVTIDPAGVEISATGNILTYFSSLGPNTGDFALKPDLLAPGQNIYMAGSAQDPLGEVYSANGFVVASGTSFSAPIVAGAAALVKQKNPKFTAAQVKSALMHTASQDVLRDFYGASVDVRGAGAGKVDAAAAVNSIVTVTPASLSFGVLKATRIPQTQQLQITNSGTAAVSVTLNVVVTRAASGVTLTLNKQSLNLAAGASDSAALTLAGTVPQPGLYAGVIVVQGGTVNLRIPYMFLVGDGRVANLIPLTGISTDGTVGEGIADGIISFRLVDTYGVPVSGIAATFTARSGASFKQMDAGTDANGIAAAEPILGALPGSYTFTATSGGLRTTYSAYARTKPQIATSGIVNAANFDASTPVAPGSYVTIFGTNLSDFTGFAKTTTLPMAIGGVRVSFDVPSAKISVPGRLTFVSSRQVNLQIPWELQNQSSALVKVVVGDTNGTVVTLPLANHSPGIFEVGTSAAAALDAFFKLLTAANPAKRGQAIQIFANGLGPVTNQPASGEPASATKLSQTITTPVVMIGGQAAQVLFSGLAPGFPGLYQVNVIVPNSAAAGAQKLTIAIGGKTSKESGLILQ